MEIFDNSLDGVRAATRANVAAHPLVPAGLPRGETLPYRLKRDVPRALQWIGLLIGGLLAAVVGSAVVLWVLYRFFSLGEFGKFELVLVLLFAVVAWSGYKMLGRGIYVILGSRTPVPLLEIDRQDLRAGEEFRLILIQPGPVSLNGMEVDLAGDERVREEKQVRGRGTTTTVWNTHTTFLRIIFQEEDVRVRRGETLRREIKFRLPDDALPSGSSDGHHSTWRLVVESDVRFGADCTHDFPVLVQPRFG